MKRLVLVLCLSALAVPLHAQQGSSGIEGFSFVAPFRITAGNDNGFLVDRTQPNERLFILSLPPSVQPGAPDVRPKRLDDQFLMFTLPKIAFQNDSRRHELAVTYVPEVELFRKNHDQNSWSHEATASFVYFLSRKLQISAGNTYRTSKDPARTLNNVFMMLPRSRFQDNSARASVDYQTSAVMGFRLRYDHTRSTFGQTDPFQAAILDNTGRGLTFTVTRMLKPNHRLRASYSHFKIAPINRSDVNDDAVDVERSFQRPMRGATLEYRMRANPSTIFEFSGGVTSIDTGLNYTFRVNGDKRYGDFWIGGGFARSLSFAPGSPTAFANGISAGGFFDTISFRVNGPITRNIGLQLDGRASRDTSERTIGTSKSFMGLARLDYRASDRTVLFTSFQTFQQNSNDYVRTPLSRNRFMIGLEFSLSTEAQRRNDELNQDDQYVALTDQMRRRREPQQ
jgi:hypothetical protein